MTREQFDAAIERNYAYLVTFVNSYGKDWYVSKPKDYLHDTIAYYLTPNGETGIAPYTRIREDDERGFRGCIMRKFLYILYDMTDSVLDQKFEAHLEERLSTYEKLHFNEFDITDVAILPSQSPSPLDDMLDNEVKQAEIEDLDQLIYHWSKLPEHQQELVELIITDGLTHAEVAKEWGVSRQQVTKLWGHALQTLREELREHNEDDSYDESS